MGRPLDIMIAHARLARTRDTQREAQTHAILAHIRRRIRRFKVKETPYNDSVRADSGRLAHRAKKQANGLPPKTRHRCASNAQQALYIGTTTRSGRDQGQKHAPARV